MDHGPGPRRQARPNIGRSSGGHAGRVFGKEFRVLREVGTGSWLSRPLHGHGLGKEMRAAVLHLAFVGLGAMWAVTDAYEDNPASRGVTRALGYAVDGEAGVVRRGQRARLLRFRMSRQHWGTIRRDDIEIEGRVNRASRDW